MKNQFSETPQAPVRITNAIRNYFPENITIPSPKEKEKTLNRLEFMDRKELTKIFFNQKEVCQELLVEKAKEYATSDRLHNFRTAAELTDSSMADALLGMMLKHTISIYDLCNEKVYVAKKRPIELWNEKITDHINYLILLLAVLSDKGYVMTITEFEEIFDWAFSTTYTQIFEELDAIDNPEDIDVLKWYRINAKLTNQNLIPSIAQDMASSTQNLYRRVRQKDYSDNDEFLWIVEHITQLVVLKAAIVEAYR